MRLNLKHLAAVTAVSAAGIPLSTSGWSRFSPGGVALLPDGSYAAVWNWLAFGGRRVDADVRMQWVRPNGSLAFPKGYREVAANLWHSQEPRYLNRGLCTVLRALEWPFRRGSK